MDRMRQRLLDAASELRRLADALEALAGAEYVDRKTAGIAGRAWDRLIAAGMPHVTQGRRRLARADDVRRALCDVRTTDKPFAEKSDEIELLLMKAGLRKGGRR